ncbi:MAG: restriction endonuclease subunit S [Nitrospirae bacterium]|nr:restriction endonuclease subunit S [Nitrospirota bacterium]
MSESMIVKFEDIAEHIAVRVNPKYTDYNIYVGLEHLDTDSLRIKRKGIPADVEGEKLSVRKGDIIFGKRRVYQRKVAIADFDGICSAHAMVLRPKEDIIIKELFPFFMQSENFMKCALQISVGSLSPTINWKTLAVQEFTIPGKRYQEKIAATLWAAEDCIVKNERFIEKAEQTKKVLIQELFSKGIGHTELKKTPIGNMPKKWGIKELSYISIIKYGLGQPPALIKEGFPMIRATDIDKGKIDTKKIVRVDSQGISKNKACFLKKGDIIVVRSGVNTGDLAMYNLELPNSLAGYDLIVSPNSEIIYPSFLAHYLLGSTVQNYFKSQSTRSAQPHLNSKQLGKTLIPIPCLSEQRQIADILNQADITITKAADNIVSTKALKMKLINQYFSGCVN